jgi:hypothetical protein
MNKIGLRWLGALAVSVGLVGAEPSNAAPRPIARAARSCGYYDGLGGYTYVESLTVTRTSCRTGRKLVQRRGKVRGWHCSRKVLSRSPTQYVGRETCTSARKRVVYTFSQNA